MSLFMVDIEADGPIPGDYSMVSIGVVLVDGKLDRTFYGQLKPISDRFEPNHLAVTGHTREETLGFDDPREVLERLENWLNAESRGRPHFVADNAFDWMFVCWYYHHFLGRNPFGIGSTNLGSLYKGVVRDMFQNFKHLRKTPHTHHPVDDALGNAEALMAIKERYNLKIRAN